MSRSTSFSPPLGLSLSKHVLSFAAGATRQPVPNGRT